MDNSNTPTAPQVGHSPEHLTDIQRAFERRRVVIPGNDAQRRYMKSGSMTVHHADGTSSHFMVPTPMSWDEAQRLDEAERRQQDARSPRVWLRRLAGAAQRLPARLASPFRSKSPVKPGPVLDARWLYESPELPDEVKYLLIATAQIDQPSVNHYQAIKK